MAAAVLRRYHEGRDAAWTQGKYRAAESYDLSGIVLCETAARTNGSAGAQDAKLIAYARIGRRPARAGTWRSRSCTTR